MQDRILLARRFELGSLSIRVQEGRRSGGGEPQGAVLLGVPLLQIAAPYLLRLDFFTQAQAQLPELPGRYGIGRFSHQTRGFLGFGEGNDIADGRSAG